uniref:Uncharacterized protein n=1 Tax=Lactuca sativa TaxID=4236 RepID=A0A9R1X6M2_LACSA|nr:hypothetical protein LSAT_V11C600337200 [Lactuca sativa]
MLNRPFDFFIFFLIDLMVNLLIMTPEINISELGNLFLAPNKNAAKSKSAPIANKPEKVQLIDHRRPYNCEIMLSKVKILLRELMVS